MTPDTRSRRSFLSHVLAGAGASVALGSLPRIAEAYGHAARQAVSAEPTFHFFGPAEAADLAAVCDQIVPSEPESPGAREAGAVYFIDYAVGKLQPELQPLFREGLAALTAEARKTDESKRFSGLTAEQQIEVLQRIESTAFFKQARAYTLMGFLADPKYGGNRDQVGWKHIGFDNLEMYEPPFGFYDAEVAAAKKDGPR